MLFNQMVIVNPYDLYFGEVNLFKNFKMSVVGNNVFSIAAYGTINKFVVVRVG